VQRIITVNLPYLLLVAVLACALSFLFSFTVPVSAASPGSAADPLVTQEWVDDYVQKSFAPLNQRLDQLEQKVSGNVYIVLTIGSSLALVNGKTTPIPAPPRIMGTGYTMAPARFIGEALNLNVDWDAINREVTFSGQGQSITLTVDHTTASINGHIYTMLTAPVIVGGYTLVHVRFISEVFNCQVDWDPHTRQVAISK
jgi:hypothetical protein